MQALAEFRAAPLGDARVVWVAGELDLSNCDALEEAVAHAAADRPSAVVIDLSALLYLDSSAVRSLVLLARGETPLRVVAPPGTMVRRSLDVLGLDQVLGVHATAEEAVRST